ncbi:MAG: hypothetical protein M0C28_35240 [Candidatus Moduliflexus flocculans]|nr:hypothetical protein [Candidatus Moduliflexus flocculans]
MEYGQPSHVPNQYLGYSIQATRMVCLLLNAPAESTVSIEVFDDVGITYEDGNQLAQQVKAPQALTTQYLIFQLTSGKLFVIGWTLLMKANYFLRRQKFEIYVSKPFKRGLG